MTLPDRQPPMTRDRREQIARLAWFMADDFSAVSAMSPANDAHWEHWRTQDATKWCFDFADAVAALPEVGEVERPTEPGAFIGDIFFGHPVKSTMGTHRWTGSEWEELPDEAAVLMELLGEARARAEAAERARDEAVAEIERLRAKLDGLLPTGDGRTDAAFDAGYERGVADAGVDQSKAARAAALEAARDRLQSENATMAIKVQELTANLEAEGRACGNGWRTAAEQRARADEMELRLERAKEALAEVRQWAKNMKGRTDCTRLQFREVCAEIEDRAASALQLMGDGE